MAKEYVDINTLKYLLYQVHALDDLFGFERYEGHDRPSMDMFLDAIKDFADRDLFPFFKEMDDDPAGFDNGEVRVHEQVAVMMKKGGEMGVICGPLDYDQGGLQIPFMVHTAATYILDAANNHLPGYATLTLGAAELIVHFANQNLKDTYVPNMLLGAWGGTMCLTEPQAGSSLSDITTKATLTDEGYYKISGQKIFISGGDYQYVENIVHLVLARIDGAPEGTKGISLFVVPKNRVETDGSLVGNDVKTLSDFEKMGQRGFATTHLGFGDSDDCQGWLVGEANQGLKYMFLMMNDARIGVGRGAAAIAMAAYQASLQYAKERAQGRKISETGKKDPGEDQCLIIEHPDVRRMLFLQKAIAEGSLSLILLAAKYHDLQRSVSDHSEKEKYQLLLEIITPMVKTYPAEAGALAVSNGLQVLGGYGFCSDFILQQYYRDIRIFSIYEGTTGIQSQDLLGRKVLMNNGKALQLLIEEIGTTIAVASDYKDLQEWAATLKGKLTMIHEVLVYLKTFANKENYERYLSDANLFMEFLSYVVIGWNWLEMAYVAKQALDNKDAAYSEAFYESKIHTMKFYFKYELTKTNALAETLMHKEVLTQKMEKEFLV
ncbi:butyryl-CoA dehydrogenase [Arenibacter nanhaiticus]|uniref:Butyryl-CoA dehydrogenase n=1 Tax=Arenibacter nanhaiticus TaxID=558155 RepID=A0A1M6EAY5_9FLAO|nr:acyl-CoA dehydrogenase [Arenibacter nanhaiticus]SHI82500.1 butyryl-CoA dehydrogenase [Arenibacter nanhaiticus]